MFSKIVLKRWIDVRMLVLNFLFTLILRCIKAEFAFLFLSKYAPLRSKIKARENEKVFYLLSFYSTLKIANFCAIESQVQV